MAARPKADTPPCPCCGGTLKPRQRACVVYGERYCRRCKGGCGKGLGTTDACRAACHASDAGRGAAPSAGAGEIAPDRGQEGTES